MAALVTAAEVGGRLGWPLTPAEETQITAFIDDITVLAEDYCGKDFVLREDESFDLPVVDSRILGIPPRYLPYLAVTSVAFADGEPLEGWTYTSQTLWRDEGWDDEGQVVEVTGSWGYRKIPAALKVAVINEVIRWKSVTPGVISERTGEREVEYEATSSRPESLSGAARSALRAWRSSGGSINLRRC